MSSDYDFSDEEEYNEYYDDEEAMDIEGGMFPWTIYLMNWLRLISRGYDRFCLVRGGH